MRLLITITLVVAGFAATADVALADKKEVAKAFKTEYQLTKRNLLTGQAKTPGTVVYIVREGLLGIKPVAAIPEMIIEAGEVVVPSSGSLPLPVGEEMHVYSARTSRDSLRLLLGTVRSYEAPGVLGTTIYQPYQLALRFRYPNGLESVSTENVLADVEGFLSKEYVAKALQVVDSNTPDSQQSPSEQTAPAGNPAARQAGNSTQPSQSARQSDGRSMKGLEPIGPINKPGCEGIEVIGYAQTEFGTGQYYYYAAIRNNTSVTKLVGVRHIGGRTIHGRNREGSGDLTVKAGDIKKYEIDLSINPPILFEVDRCL